MRAIPKLREYSEDVLQIFLDETAEINAIQNNNLSEIERVNSEWLIAKNEIERVNSEWLISLKDRDQLHSDNVRLRQYLNSPKALAKALAKLLISRLHL